MEFQELLLQSCVEMNREALDSCTSDFIDEKYGCKWYHSVWQYLRVLDCVSAPQWHKDFYPNSIEECCHEKTKIRVLISGTADYSLLHIFVDVLTRLGLKAEIVVLDKCLTPLKICEWYMNNCGKVLSDLQIANLNKITVNTVKYDLLYYNPKKQFDIICTDAFLTRFEKDKISNILQLWSSWLADNGKIITTIRIYDKEISKNLIEGTKDILSYISKVKNAYNIFQRNVKEFPISWKKMEFMAHRYIVRMNSYSLGTKDDIEKLIKSNGLKLEKSTIQNVEGEIRETDYLQVVLKK